jgi:hypothetical protein
MMPPHDTYIETQLGGGVIMRRKPSALNNIAIDLDLNIYQVKRTEKEILCNSYTGISKIKRLGILYLTFHI